MTKDIKGTTLEHLTEKRVRSLAYKNMMHSQNIMNIFRLCKQHNLKLDRKTAFDIYKKVSYYNRKQMRINTWWNAKFNDEFKGKWKEIDFQVNKKRSEEDFDSWIKLFKWKDILR